MLNNVIVLMIKIVHTVTILCMWYITPHSQCVDKGCDNGVIFYVQYFFSMIKMYIQWKNICMNHFTVMCTPDIICYSRYTFSIILYVYIKYYYALFFIMHEGYNVQFILFESNIILVYFPNVQFFCNVGVYTFHIL